MSTQTVGDSSNQQGTLAGTFDLSSPLSVSVAELFYPSFKRLFEGEEFVDDIEDDLGAANINSPVEIYMSAALGYGTIIGGIIGLILSGIALFILTTAFVTPSLSASTLPYGHTIGVEYFVAFLNFLQYPVLAALIGVTGAVVGFFTAFSIAILYPKQVKRSRARDIDLVLGDAIAFMYSLSVGGTNQLQVMEAVANAEDTYGEVSIEFKQIVYEMRYFNTDYQTAVQNVAQLTPSSELEAFLSDMLSVVNSGGNMTAFLDTQQEMMRERGQKKQEQMLDTLELFGEMYMSLNILPMGLLIVLVIVSMMGDPQYVGLYATVYAVLPGLNIMFALIIATVKKDEVGDGILKTEGNVAARGEDETRVSRMGVIDYYNEDSDSEFFSSIRSHEFRHRVTQILRSPWEFFRLRPLYVLWVTVPLTVLVMGTLIGTGLASTAPRALVNDAYIQTVMWLYIPVFLNVGPLAVFYEWNRRTRGRITDTLTQDIRKLANANETGQPLLEAMRSSTTGQESLLATEFQLMYKKTKFGTSLSPALVEFNNRYRIPRLARIVKLIQKAQEASSNITEVLQTAAVTSRYQDDLVQDRLQRTRMQVAVTGITFIVFLGVIMMMEVYFIGEMIGSVDLDDAGPLGGGFGGMDVDIVSMLFFHAVTIQALCAGAISGYIQTGEFNSSYKYIFIYTLLTALVWGAIAV